MTKIGKVCNALIILTLSGILLAAYGVQFLKGEKPCPLCLLQRFAMMGVATGLLLNITFGIRTSHYGLSLLSALAGGTVALRQISLHVCPGFSVFGVPVLGLSLYTWSFLIFTCVVLAVALLLLIAEPMKEELQQTMDPLSKIAFLMIFLIAFANVLTTFAQCGFGICGE